MRILIADDHGLIRSGLKALIETRSGWSVCGMACTGREAVQLARELEPDIAILDLRIPELTGTDAARHIKKFSPRTQTLLLSFDHSDDLIRSAIDAGVQGYLLQSDCERDLLVAIERLAAGQTFFPAPEAGLTPLTLRERTILQLISDGKSNEETASFLNLSPRVYDTIGFYIQDDLRATSRLTLNLGLRYEFATSPYGPNNNVYGLRDVVTAQPPNFGILGSPWSNAASHHNFSPRLGFAWDVFGTGKTAVRGGAGVYYDVGDYGILALSTNYDMPPRTYDYAFTNPLINPLTTVPVGEGMLDPFTQERNGCADVVLPTLPPCAVAGDQYNMQQPSRAQWNLTIDQQLPWQMDLAVSYVGTVGWHLRTQIDQNYENATIDANGNFIPLQTDSRGEPVYCVPSATVPGTCAFSQNPAVSSTAAAAAISNLSFERVNPLLGESDWEIAIGRSWYHSLQVVLNKRVSSGLQFQNAFTWSKNMDNAVADALGDYSIDAIVPTGPNLHSLVYNNGPSGYNIPLNDRLSAIYHFGNLAGDGMLRKFTNGWWTSAIFQAQSGYPFTPTESGDRLLGVSQIGSIIPNRAANYDAGTVIVGKQTEWFNPDMFALQAAGTDGNAGRNFLNGPGLSELDWSLVKDTKVGWLGEAGSVEFRAEIFNILNHANFALPSASVYSLPGGAAEASTLPGQFGSTSALAPLSTAGLISSTVTTSRQIQLALKVLF